MSGTNRSIAIDLVRVIALLGVITRHTWYDPEGWPALIICPGAIAVFFLLSGYFWSDRRTVADEVDVRFTTLLVPYLAWMIAIGVPLYLWLIWKSSFGQVWPLAAAAAYGPQFASRPLSVAWFFPTMFFALVLLRWLAGRPRALTWALLAVVVTLTVVTPNVFRWPPLAAGIALPCLVYLVGGQELRRHRDRITRPALVGAVLLAISIVITYFPPGDWNGAAHDSRGVLLEIKAADFGTPVVGLLNGVLIGAALVLLAEGCERFVPEFLREPVTNAAQTATFVMFFHPVVLFVLDQPNDGGWVAFVAALILPYVLARFLIKRNLLPWFTGIRVGPPYPVSQVFRRREADDLV